MERDEQTLRSSHEYFREHLPFFLSRDFKSCYAHKLYDWQRDFLLCKKLLAFLTAGNQAGKSASQILKCLNMAMRKDLWPYWFAKRRPTTFFYLYPDAKTATLEVEEKWVKVYLPRGEMKNDHRYGWELHYGEKGFVESIVFKTGVTVYFRTYSQDPKTLQAATLDAVFCDEEPPEKHYDELMVRTQAAQSQGSGFMSCVFTATIGQDYLYKCMEMQGTDHETFKGAWKKQVSLFDCLVYADGTPSEIFSRENIENVLMPRYRNQKEIQKRVYGRFVKDTGLIYEEFELARNIELPGVTDVTGWRSYVGIDYGAGGDYGHSSAIVHVKVDPTYSKARVLDVWTSQKRRMTQSDLLVQYKEIASRIGPHQAFADWGATDLFTLAAREGIRLEKAEKSHDIGINLLNTLFKEAQLKIVTTGKSHAQFLIQELQTISEDTAKRHRVDDCTDALRYAISLCPMRLTALKLQEEKKAEDLSKINPRLLFYRGLDRKDDPMLRPDEDMGDDFDDAVEQFEGLL